MTKVFISYIHEESDVANALQHFIRQKLDTYDVFLSSEWQIYAGEDWLRKVTTELRAAQVVVLLLSPQSVTRPWVNFEAGGAWLGEKPVIPVCHAGMTPERLPKPYSSLQALTIPDDDYYLIRSIHHHFYPSGMHLPPMPFPLDDPEAEAFRSAVLAFNTSLAKNSSA